MSRKIGTLKRTTADVAQYFADHGCELMDEYMGCMSPMDYRCSCGNYGTATWNNFTKGKRCGNCTKWGQSKKRSLEDVRKIFRERGCEFLDTEFKGIHHKHRYRCKCGREAEITFAGFHHQNQYCKQCGLEKNKGESHHDWKPDREKHRLDQLFRKKCYKALSTTLKATGSTKVGHTKDMLGFGPKELQEHITAHPNWVNVKDLDWSIDHIYPIKAFLDYGIRDIAIINCLENLQPMLQSQNTSKSDSYDSASFKKWLSARSF